jgi:hypothetical protein
LLIELFLFAEVKSGMLTPPFDFDINFPLSLAHEAALDGNHRQINCNPLDDLVFLVM